MLWNAKNGTIQLDGTDMDDIRFGSGTKHLVILPGLGDGLQTVKGTAIPMEARDFKRTVLDFLTDK